MTNNRAEGKVAFVTGAARGLGRDIAVRLAEEGADVVVVDICRSVGSVPYGMPAAAELDKTADLVRSLGRRAVAVAADVRDPAAVRDAADRGVTELGRLDIVVANAGIISYGAALDLTAEQWTDVLDTNLTGTWHTVRAGVPHAIAGGRGGSVVLTSSTAGLKGTANIAHYAAAKHGVVGLMRTLALELAPHLIRVNSVNPTTANTPMVQNPANMKLILPGLENPTHEQYVAAMTAQNVLPVPWVEPRDVSNAVLFLASDEARYITGVTLPVDAGWLLR